MNRKEKIAEIVMAVLQIESERMNQVSEESPLNVLGMDSLNCVDIVLTIEEEFDVVFNDEELLLDNLNSIEKLTRLVDEKRGEHSIA